MDISNRRLLVTRHILPICSILAVVILWSLLSITSLVPEEYASPTLDKKDSGEQIVEVPAHNSSHMKEFFNDQTRIMARVNRYCQAANLSIPIDPYVYSYDKNRQFLVCRNHKVASYTLMEIFRIHLSGLPKEMTAKYVDKWGSTYKWTAEHFQLETPNLVRDKSQNSILYSIVRHPFERIVSAYENKLVKNSNNWIYKWFTDHYGEPSFPKFVDMIIDGAARCGEDKCSSMDVHWRPYYAACSYCDLQYNFISKIENLGRDMEVIFTDILGVPLPREYHANVSNGDSVEDKTRKYLEQLTAETREQLYQVYKHDFLLFDYVPY